MTACESIPATKLSLWDFSVKLYQCEGIERICLDLQDNKGVDILMLFYCFWAGAKGFRLTEQDTKQQMAAIAPWHDQVLKPFRSLRRRVKDLSEDGEDKNHMLYQAFKSLELQIETAILKRLEEKIITHKSNPSPSLVIKNCLLYCHLAQIPADSEITEHLIRLLKGYTPNLSIQNARSCFTQQNT